MAWYYYSGNVSRAIPVKNGLTKSVRPHSKVEITNIEHQAKALIRKGLLTRTGKPKGAALAKDFEAKEEIKIEDVVKVEGWAMAISEKGKTVSGQQMLKTLAEESRTQVELADIAGDAVINEPTGIASEEDQEGSEEEVAQDDNNKKTRKRRQK